MRSRRFIDYILVAGFLICFVFMAGYFLSYLGVLLLGFPLQAWGFVFLLSFSRNIDFVFFSLSNPFIYRGFGTVIMITVTEHHITALSYTSPLLVAPPPPFIRYPIPPSALIVCILDFPLLFSSLSHGIYLACGARGFTILFGSCRFFSYKGCFFLQARFPEHAFLVFPLRRSAYIFAGRQSTAPVFRTREWLESR